MDTYTLTSKAKPKVSAGQAERLWQAMDDLGGGPATLEQIVRQCEYRRYRSLLVTEPSVEASVQYHLRKWLKDGLVRKDVAGQ